ncbi:bis(5'-nucleosyl)-tetraphosphatase (symmetrical) YqeK [Enterococcus faecalis]|uniref:bis(5'-nucleosyl)-tetraphosphatase (symmetrical) YqeK n=1 Tax=Enterococcus faecalis TaxID=1351 RepID=UPI0009F08057|nr:bis(5'-nucleosyl)-tetraphosphatase (symmetrical) YqeK [Enterococcus faecalis]EIP8074978.1 bis(5'-nucleosyl)-tetraphosphatase (symmetrical) YqeK [Enterococcus faecalis]EIQ7146365.1 bis(5'-nucleosyl)-tetraphosphatase (symmetrical) YqeK [Enterococcus faecalis]EIQ7161514.1 bis(5'-nucleosyl)-tetraphosphatase (symmetrical) YqeK [Enterococcus faecalis]EMC2392202.1 bis(5'-nucleosyl)-tetraphosphatase (symmetrical) YqeK [Enterococcus faecalis]MBX8939816.1 HD domain-containing protein [Enterococcus fa
MDYQQVLKNEIKQYLVSKNCEKTYYHCMEVGEYAYQLGEKYLTSPEKVSIAGYLHDISAVYPNNQRISVAQKYGIELNETEMAFPMIIHQKISKSIAKMDFGIEDNEILSAIECHTTLKKNYSDIDLVLFVADKIKWDQEGKPPYLDGLLQALNCSLENAAYFYIDYILKHDIKVVHPWLWDAYNQLNLIIK